MMIGVILLFSFIFFHSNLGQRCTTDIFIDSMFTFRHYDEEKLMAVKMITYGDNSSISCLITNKTKDEFKLSLKKKFEWVFTPLFQSKVSYKKVKISKKINLMETNKTIYVTGSCNELQIYRFGPDAVGIYRCVPKRKFRKFYDKYVQVEIFVDGELIGPNNECPEDLKKIPTSTSNRIPPSFVDHFSAKQNRLLHIGRYDGVASTDFFVPSLEQDCSPCFNLKDPIDKTGILVERNSCVRAYFVIRNELIGKDLNVEKRYFTSFHSCEVREDMLHYSKTPSCLNSSICVPELCSLPVDVKPIDLSKNFTVNLKVKKNRKFKIEPGDLNIASYIEEPEGYNIEMICPMINATDPKVKGRVRWYKCNTECVRITKSQRKFIRYNMKQSARTIKILKLESNDTGKFACVRNNIILGALSLVVTPPLGYFDIRSPIGSMFAATFFVLFVYMVLCIFRISAKNMAAKMKTKTQAKGDHKRIKYKKLPKNT